MEASKKKPTLVREDAPASAPDAEPPAPAAEKPDAAPAVVPGPPPPSAPAAAVPRMARAPFEYSAVIEQMLTGATQPKNAATPTLLARIKDIGIDLASVNQKIAQEQQAINEKQQLVAQLAAHRESLTGALRSQGETIWHLETAEQP